MAQGDTSTTGRYAGANIGGAVAGPGGYVAGAAYGGPKSWETGNVGSQEMKDKLFAGGSIKEHLGIGTYKPGGLGTDVSGITDTTRMDALAADITGQRNMAGGRLTPMAAGVSINQDPQAQFRNQQMALAQQLQAQAQGQGPSLAQMQLNQATNRNIAQQMAMAGSGGGNAALAQRQAADAAAGFSQQAAADSAQLRLAEQLQAQQALAGVSGQGRAQDIGLATSQAGLSQQTQLANQGAALSQQQINDAAVNAANNQLMGIGQSGIASQLEAQKLLQQGQLGMEDINLRAYEGGSQRRIGAGGKLMDSAGQAMGAIGGMMSDENVKTDIEPGDAKLVSFLEAIGTHSYRYKNKKHGKGSFVSPMAQEIEKTELGEGLVEETPEGKRVNYGKAGGLFLGAAASMHKRIASLEDALRSEAMEKRRMHG